ncbi:MAG: tetratricopeptide repeat protein [Candidatus Omnitrophota bacterium]
MIKLFYLQVILGFCLPALLFAESVTLKSGKRIEGKILEETDQYIKIEEDGRALYYERKFISSIEATPQETVAAAPKDEALLTDTDYLKEGLKYGAEARFEEAEEALKKGLAVKADAHNLKEVLKLINQLKSGSVKQAYALHMFKGSNYLMNRQFEEAMPEFLAALKMDSNPDLYYYLGVCSYSLAQYEQAIGYLEKAAVEIKDDNEIYYNLGISHYALRQYPQAVGYLKKALEINAQDADSYGVLGTCHLILGQKQLAREELSKSIELFRKQGDYLKASDVETFLKQIN